MVARHQQHGADLVTGHAHAAADGDMGCLRLDRRRRQLVQGNGRRQRGRRLAIIASAAALEIACITKVIEQQFPASQTALRIRHHLLERLFVALLLVDVDLRQLRV